MYPWQVEKVVQERDMRFWTDLSQSTIYKQLRSLDRANLVEYRQEAQGGRLRKVYSVTQAGREALLSKLREILREPEHLKWRVDLGTYNLHLLPRAEARECLEEYRRRLEEGIECYRSLEVYLDSCGCPRHRCAVARRPIYLMEGEIRWVDEFLGSLEGV
jgi:DNA-binding PadR family transcriptional regulator